MADWLLQVRLAELLVKVLLGVGERRVGALVVGVVGSVVGVVGLVSLALVN